MAPMKSYLDEHGEVMEYTGHISSPGEVASCSAGSGGAVDHPSHYNTGKIEVIDFLEDQKLGFHLGNSVKYICRAGYKNPEKTKEDLEKAIWYIRRYIDSVLPEVQDERD